MTYPGQFAYARKGFVVIKVKDAADIVVYDALQHLNQFERFVEDSLFEVGMRVEPDDVTTVVNVLEAVNQHVLVEFILVR